MQRALRQALCTAAAKANGGMEATPTPLSAGLGARKPPACLLTGYLVEIGVEGWEETKAAMIPPPQQLLEAAQGPAPGASDSRVAPGDGSEGSRCGRNVDLILFYCCVVFCWGAGDEALPCVQ